MFAGDEFYQPYRWYIEFLGEEEKKNNRQAYKYHECRSCELPISSGFEITEYKNSQSNYYHVGCYKALDYMSKSRMNVLRMEPEKASQL